MQRLRLAIIGFGRLGQACAGAIHASDDLALVGLVRRPENLHRPLPEQFAEVPIVSHPSELGDVDAVLICLPTERVREAATELLRHHTPIVEAAAFDIPSRQAHWSALDRMALRRGVAAAVGAGWDPGARGLFEDLFAALCPKGSTTTHDRPGVSLHHSLAARAVPGVRDALCAEFRGADGSSRRYVYLEPLPGADVARAAAAIQSDPLFLGQETVVLPVRQRGDAGGGGPRGGHRAMGPGRREGPPAVSPGRPLRPGGRCRTDDGGGGKGTADASTWRLSLGQDPARRTAAGGQGRQDLKPRGVDSAVRDAASIVADRVATKPQRRRNIGDADDECACTAILTG